MFPTKLRIACKPNGMTALRRVVNPKVTIFHLDFTYICRSGTARDTLIRSFFANQDREKGPDSIGLSHSPNPVESDFPPFTAR